VRLYLALGLPVLLFGPAAGAQVDSARARTGSIEGIVVIAEAAVPLANALVSIASLNYERFTDEEGRFAIRGIAAGMYHLRIRRIGYSPRDLDIEVRDDRSTPLRIPLTHLAVELDRIRVYARTPCTNPGLPTEASDSVSGAVASLFEQLNQNAEQFRVLTERYPFVYAVERVLGSKTADSVRRIQSVDTLVIGSATRWSYSVGSVVARRMNAFNRMEWVVNLPTLINFAEATFQRNHCFAYGGVERIDGFPMARIDFLAADRITAPDVDGQIYLDAGTFQIRRVNLTVTHIPPTFGDVEQISVVTRFREIAPAIPVFDRVSGSNSIRPMVGRATSGEEPVFQMTEEQRLVGFHFLKEAPSGALPPRPPLSP
jgi:hypothetical protein